MNYQNFNQNHYAQQMGGQHVQQQQHRHPNARQQNMKRGRSWEQLQNRHTRVLFVRNVSEVTPDRHLADLCARFGPVTQILQMVEKRSAFIEFEVFEHAEQAMIEFKSRPPLLDGRQLQFAYSGRDKIKMPDIPFPKNNPPSKVLNLKISNIKYQITIDVCKKLMGKDLDKVSIREPLSGEGCVNVLTQFPDQQTADRMKDQLDGKYIYTGCNRIAATYSHLQGLEIPTNNVFCHDFTKDFVQQTPDTGPVTGLLGGNPSDDLHNSQNPVGALCNGSTPNSLRGHGNIHHGLGTPPSAQSPFPAPVKSITETDAHGNVTTRTVVDMASTTPGSHHGTPHSSYDMSMSGTPGSTPKPWHQPTLSHQNSHRSLAHSHSMHSMHSAQSEPQNRGYARSSSRLSISSQPCSSPVQDQNVDVHLQPATTPDVKQPMPPPPSQFEQSMTPNVPEKPQEQVIAQPEEHENVQETVEQQLKSQQEIEPVATPAVPAAPAPQVDENPSSEVVAQQ